MKKPEYILKKYLSNKICKKCNGTGTIRVNTELSKSQLLEAVSVFNEIGQDDKVKYINNVIDKVKDDDIIYQDVQCDCCQGYGKLILWEARELFDFNKEVYEASDWFVEKAAAENEMNRRNKKIEQEEY
jgi:RecJ-like exonuclease